MTQMAMMTRGELTAACQNGALLVVPIGATEQHGEHLAVGTDHLISEHIAAEAAAKINAEATAKTSAEAVASPAIVVAPTLTFGHSHHHLPFGGTISITPATFQQVLIEIGSTAVTSGFQRLYFLNGHGGNVEIAATAAREITRHTGRPVGAGSYWTMARDRLTELTGEQSSLVPGHAGFFESSLMLALHPKGVRDERPSRGAGDPRAAAVRLDAGMPWFWHAIDGWTDEAVDAAAEDGHTWLAAIVDAVVEGLTDFIAKTDREPEGWSSS